MSQNASESPNVATKVVGGRRSKWTQVFEEGRSTPQTWRRVVFPLKRSTAGQVASDIRNAHKRGEARIAGLNPNEKWDAAWDEKDGEFYVYVKYQGEES